MKEWLNMIDKALRKYMAIDSNEIIPDIITKNGNKLQLVSTESYKRHTFT